MSSPGFRTTTTKKKEDGSSVFRMPKLMSFPSLGDTYMSSIMKWGVREATEDDDDMRDDEIELDDVEPNIMKNDSGKGPVVSEYEDQRALSVMDHKDKGQPSFTALTSAAMQIVCEESDSSQKSDDSCGSFFLLTASPVQVSTCEEILPTRVRWFYKQENDKKLTPFIGYDSLRIELKYRSLINDNDELCPSDLCNCGMSKEEVDLLKSEQKIVVRGGLYEVDVTNRLCTSIFWAGDTSTISRGIWFYDGSWQPLEESYSDEIESEHLGKFKDGWDEEEQPSSPKRNVVQENLCSVSDEQVERFHQDLKTFEDQHKSFWDETINPPEQAIHHVQFPEFHVEWYSPKEVYLYSEAKSSKIMRSVSARFGFQKSGYKLQRGYYVDATLADKQPDITHIVFVIHGIGQKRDYQRIIRNCGSLRKCAAWLKERYFSHLMQNNQRSEFFPVEWRSSLRLDGDTVDSITLHQVRGLREFLNGSAMDILYYTSPLYRMELIKGLQTELNRLFDLFCLRHPNFVSNGGRVSIVAHSLGCVIAYDGMTGWNPVHLYESYLSNLNNEEILCEDSCISDERTSLLHELHQARSKVCELEQRLEALNDNRISGPNKLHFSVENFFCLGSPLAVFLALRGVRPAPNATQENIFPKSLVKRLFNIYHPTDPVAYRLEPLVLKHYSGIMPLYIHFYSNSDKKPYEEMKPEVLPRETLDKRPHSPGVEDGLDSNTGSPSRSVKGESRWSMVWSTLVRRKENTTIMVQQDLKETAVQDSDYGHPVSPTALTAVTATLAATTMTSISNGINGSVPNMEEDDCHNADEDVKDIGLEGRISPVCSGASSPMGHSLPRTPDTPELEYRLDYMLREGNLEISSLSALTSHTSYWTSYDVAYFILSYLHPDATEPLAACHTSPTHSTK